MPLHTDVAAPFAAAPDARDGLGGDVLLTPLEMARVDARAAALGTPPGRLMEAAGRAAAAAIARRWTRRETLILCGPGANGGDGYACARALAGLGWPVRTASLAAPQWTGPDAALDERSFATLGPAALIVDALFGAGLARPLTGACAALADQARGRAVAAIDLPSGVSGLDGTVAGSAFQAELTITFCRRKPGHVLQPGRARCGAVVLADIGVPEAAVAAAGARLWRNGPGLWREALRRSDWASHKHQRGAVAVASGGPANTGAARLAAQAALRAGAGLVTVLSPPSALLVNAMHLTAVMVASVAGPEALAEAAGRAQALVLGPAFGLERVKPALAALSLFSGVLVLDADGLSAFADQPAALFSQIRPNTVLTPHEGEFTRLFPDLATLGSKVERARQAAARAGCVVLLKGSDTVIAAPDGRAAINPTGTPHLATAGAGDVLAGVIAALAAQGAPPFEAACAGAWLHGAAGETLGPGLIAEDLPPALPAALRRAGW